MNTIRLSLSVNYTEQKKYDLAIDQLISLEQHLPQSANKNLYLKMLLLKANAYLEIGNSTSASQVAQRALVYFSSTGDLQNEARVHALLANIDCRNANYSQASTHINHVISLSRLSGDTSNLIDALVEMAKVTLAQDNFKQTISFNKQLMDLAL